MNAEIIKACDNQEVGKLETQIVSGKKEDAGYDVSAFNASMELSQDFLNSEIVPLLGDILSMAESTSKGFKKSAEVVQYSNSEYSINISRENGIVSLKYNDELGELLQFQIQENKKKYIFGNNIKITENDLNSLKQINGDLERIYQVQLLEENKRKLAVEKMKEQKKTKKQMEL